MSRMTFAPKRNAAGLIATLVAVLVVVTLTNGLIFALGWAGAEAGPQGQARPLLPPGWVIGAVWTVLFALMAAAYWWLASAADDGQRAAAVWIAAFMAFCLAYPFYTRGFSDPTAGLIGNLASLAAAAYLTGRLHTISTFAAALIAPTIAWTAFATVAAFGP